MLARFKWSSLPDIKITHFSSESIPGSITSHLFYHVEIREALRVWTVKRRYSEFKSLHAELVDIFKDSMSILPIFPTVSVSPLAPSSESIRARQEALQSYLRAILCKGPLLHTTHVRNFLQPPDGSLQQKSALELDIEFFLPPPSSDLILPEQLRLRKGVKPQSEELLSSLKLNEDDFEMIDVDDDDLSQLHLEASDQASSSISVADDIIADEIEKINTREREMGQDENLVDRPPPRSKSKSGSQRRRTRTDSASVSIELVPLNSMENAAVSEPPPASTSAPVPEQKHRPVVASPEEDLILLHTLIDSVREKLAFFASFSAAHSSSADSAYFVYIQTQRQFVSSVNTLKQERALLQQLSDALAQATLENKLPQRPTAKRNAMQDLLKDPFSDTDEESLPSPVATEANTSATPEQTWMLPATLSRYLADCARASALAIDWSSKFIESAEQAAVHVAERTTLIESLVSSAESLIHEWMDGKETLENKNSLCELHQELQKDSQMFSVASRLTSLSSPYLSNTSISDQVRPNGSIQTLADKLKSAREFIESACPFVLEKPQ